MTLANAILVEYFPKKTKCNGRHKMATKRSVFQALSPKYKIMWFKSLHNVMTTLSLNPLQK